MGKIIGIDLGTTNSCVAVLEGGDISAISSWMIPSGKEKLFCCHHFRRSITCHGPMP